MIIKRPCCITARLLPGIRIGDMWISIEYDNAFKDSMRQRQYYRYYLDFSPPQRNDEEVQYSSDDQFNPDERGLAEPFEYTNNDLSSHSPSLQNALGDLLSYLCDSSDSFPTHVEKWAQDHEDELSLLANELGETTNIIDEGRNR